jgi:hypothetical protein
VRTEEEIRKQIVSERTCMKEDARCIEAGFDRPCFVLHLKSIDVLRWVLNDKEEKP